MDAGVAAVALLAVFLVASLVVFRGRSKVGLKGLGLDFSLDASNKDPQRGAVIERARAGRNVSALDESGHGARVKEVVAAAGDVSATSRHTGSDPKAGS